MSARKFILPIIGVVAVAGGATAYFQLKGASGSALSPQALAKVVPDDAYMAAFISMDSKTWSKLEEFGTPEAQKIIAQGLKDAQQKMLSNSQINYDTDLKPWIGNTMVALLPSTTGKPAKEPNMLMVVGIKDKVSALNFANKLKGQSKVKATETDYKGVKIVDFLDEKKRSTYTAVLKDYLVMAPEKGAVEQAIDTVKGEPSLASKAGIGTLFSKDVDVENPIARFYLPDYANAMQQLMASNPKATQLPDSTLEQLKRVKSIVAGVGIDNAGVRLKAVANLDEQFAKVTYQPSAGSIVAQFPTDTFALVNGAGIDRYWSQVVEQANTMSEAQLAVGLMRQQAKMLNMDLDRDLFGWMTGEFAIGLIPSNQGLLSSVGFGGVLLVDTNDRKTAEATFSKFDMLAETSVGVEKRNVGGKTVTEWKVPQGVALGHGWLDQDTAFVAIGGPLVDVVANKPNQSLDSSDTFKAVTGSLKKPNLGYFYIDLDKTMALVNRASLVSQKSTMPPETAAILNSIRGLGGTSVQADPATAQVELLLALKPAK